MKLSLNPSEKCLAFAFGQKFNWKKVKKKICFEKGRSIGKNTFVGNQVEKSSLYTS